MTVSDTSQKLYDISGDYLSVQFFDEIQRAIAHLSEDGVRTHALAEGLAVAYVLQHPY